VTKRSDEQGRYTGLRALEAFAECTDEELKRIDSLLSETSISEGRVMMREGETGLEFIVILEGRATVTRSGSELATLGPGDFVGEMALLSDEIQPRSATVTAATPMRVYVMNAGEFSALLNEVPTMREKIQRTKAVRNHPAGKKV